MESVGDQNSGKTKPASKTEREGENQIGRSPPHQPGEFARLILHPWVGLALLAVPTSIVDAICWQNSNSPMVWKLIPTGFSAAVFWYLFHRRIILHKKNWIGPTVLGFFCAVLAWVGYFAVVAIVSATAKVPVQSVAQSSSQPSNPTTAQSANAPLAVNNDAFETLPDGRIVVKRNPEWFISLFDSHTAIEATELARPYVGKWMIVSEKVYNVSSPDANTLAVSLQSDSDHMPNAYMEFSKQNWQDKLQLLRRGDSVTVLGQIESVDELGMRFKDCELK
jgi:hypothetical protein